MPVNEQAVTIAANQFVATRPDFAEYNIPVNIEAMATEIISTWGEAGLENASCWEIVFLEMKDKLLTKNPDFVEPSFAKRVDGMTSAEVGSALRHEPGFQEKFNKLSKATVPLDSTTNDPYIGLTAEGYNQLGTETRKHLYETELMFRKAVERLSKQGEI